MTTASASRLSPAASAPSLREAARHQASPRKARVLVIDDDAATGAIVASLLDPGQTEVDEARTASEGWAKLERASADVLVLDNLLPDGRGLDLLARVRQLDSRLPILFVTAEGTSGNAIEAMKLGAFDFLAKPIDLDRFEKQLAAAIEHRRLMRAPVELSPEGAADGEALVGRCASMQEVFRSIGRLARQDVPALIVGETGVGKELVARAIYQHGDRSERLFLKVNCADRSQDRLEVELFGEENPAHDDGTALHVGKLEQCDGGTLLIEEIAALAPATQSRLLQFLRQSVFERVGGTRTIRSNVRLIFTTADDPATSLRQGRLREDLYYALSAYAVRIPPLRERGDDLRLLTERFVARFSNFGRGIIGQLPRVSPEAYALLSEYDWPGNVAELQAVLRRALIESKGAVLASDFLRDLVALREVSALANVPAEDAIETGASPAALSAPIAANVTDWKRFIEARLKAGSEDIYAEAIEEMERHALTIVLTHTGGNQAKAAKALGMTRTSLRKKVLALRIRVGSFVASADEAE